MAVVLTLVCGGSISSNIDGSPICSTGWAVQPVTQPFDLAQIDPAVAASMFAGGFVISVIPWATAFAAAQLLRFIRSI